MPVDLESVSMRGSESVSLLPDSQAEFQLPPSEFGRIVFHPRYERFLKACGIDSAEAALEHPGEIVCGHPDRHTVRCRLRSRVVYMKREHLVGWRTRWRNRQAGFGWVSRSEREAWTLQRLEEIGLPGPQWLAYGTDDHGRAFLIVDELHGHVDCRRLLRDNAVSPAERRELIERAAVAVAELHEAGFSVPDLAAKHLLVNRDSHSVTLIDWQSTPQQGPVSKADRLRQLAALDASLAGNMVSRSERLRFLRAYGSVTEANLPPHQRKEPTRSRVQALTPHATRFRDRSSTRDQLPHTDTPRLVWLAGEQVCVVPELVEVWPTPAAGFPFYPRAGERLSRRESITFVNGRYAVLDRFRSFDPLGRFAAVLREKPWRSPASRLARMLFHLQRHDLPAPRLLAFGQRFTTATTAESFVVSDPIEGTVPLHRRLKDLPEGDPGRAALLQECGRLLRRLHDAGCRISRSGNEPVFGVAPAGVVVMSPQALRLSKKITDRTRRGDLHRLLQQEPATLSRTDRERLAEALFQREPVRT